MLPKWVKRKKAIFMQYVPDTTVELLKICGKWYWSIFILMHFQKFMHNSLYCALLQTFWRILLTLSNELYNILKSAPNLRITQPGREEYGNWEWVWDLPREPKLQLKELGLQQRFIAFHPYAQLRTASCWPTKKSFSSTPSKGAQQSWTDPLPINQAS